MTDPFARMTKGERVRAAAWSAGLLLTLCVIAFALR